MYLKEKEEKKEKRTQSFNTFLSLFYQNDNVLKIKLFIVNF